jgi:Protein of unknown function (DUF229)
LPYLAIRLPPDYVRRHPTALENLRRNAADDRLSTAFDLHETLLDFAGLYNSRRRPETEVAGSSAARRTRRGISLLDEIPATRTCADSDVAPHWCTCLQWRPVPVDDSNVRHAALDIVNAINRMTSAHEADCFRLALDVVKSADSYAADDRLLRFYRSADADGRVPEMMTLLPVAGNGGSYDRILVNGSEILYRVTIRTSPGGALYEATVRLVLENLRYEVDTRQISRINAYGKQPHCVADTEPHLRAYCYCVQPYNGTAEDNQGSSSNGVFPSGTTSVSIVTADEVAKDEK